MEVEKLIECLQAYFPLSLQEGWDNSGLQISPKESFIKSILLSLDITSNTVLEAYDKGCNLVISHHPLIFSPSKRIDKTVYPFNVVFKAIDLGIGIYAFHTNLDIADGGINDYLCEMFELKNVIKVEEKPVRIGEVERVLSLEEFVDLVKYKLGVEIVKFVRANNRKIKKVAICSGSCMDLLADLRGEEFDVFLSSDLKHHQAIYAKEMGINLIDATHFHTEENSKLILRDIIEKHCGDGVNVYLSDEEALPWEYK